MDAWSWKLSIFDIFRQFQKQNLLILAVFKCELLFCLCDPWVSSTCESVAVITSAVWDFIYLIFIFFKKTISIWNICKGRWLVILSSLSVTLLCFFTRSDLVVPTSSFLKMEGVRGDVWKTAEGGVMGGRATVQCFRSWVRSVDERQIVRKRERKKGWEDRRDGVWLPSNDW